MPGGNKLFTNLAAFGGKGRIIMSISKMRKETFMVIVSIVLAFETGLLGKRCPTPPGEPVPQSYCCLTFTGQASGGTLIMWDNLGRNARYIAIETIAGEPAETAIERLANAIDETNPFDWLGFQTGKKRVTSSGSELQGILGGCGSYMFAGTETGLGISRPPHSLTCNYDPNLKKLKIKWINPSADAYDHIILRINWSNYDHTGGTVVRGNADSCDINLARYPVDMNDVDILAIGVRNDIPSGAAAIHVNNNVQEELYGIPFVGDIAPNWQSWSLDSNEGKMNLEMGIRNELTFAKGRRYNPITTPQTKPFYQVIKTGSKGGTGGICRKFIGLTPGHTYRIKTRVAVLSVPNEKNWSVSVHAAPNASAQRDFTSRQMAGLEALTVSESAIKIAVDQPKGQFAEISTGNPGAPVVGGQEIKDITLPLGVDSLTVWVKCVGPSGLSAAIDWISLEDLSVQKP
jgi:hypothetical protein